MEKGRRLREVDEEETTYQLGIYAKAPIPRIRSGMRELQVFVSKKKPQLGRN